MIWMVIARYIGVRGLRKLRSMSYASSTKCDIDKKSDTVKIKTGKTKSNIGKEDRALRAAIGATALALLLVIKEGFVVRYLLGLAAIVGLVTAITKFSPVYALIGENTRKKKKNNFD